MQLGGDRGNADDLRKGPAASAARRSEASDRRASKVAAHIESAKRDGAMSLRQIASSLNEKGITAPRGGFWQAAQVKAVLDRLGK